MFDIKPRHSSQTTDKYIRDVLTQLNKYCTGEVSVITCSPHTHKLTERRVALNQMKFVLHYQLNKRSQETLYVEGFCLNNSSQEAKTRLKEFLENKQK